MKAKVALYLGHIQTADDNSTPKKKMLLTELLESQDAVGILLAPFLGFYDQLKLLETSHKLSRSSFRREVFASNCWSIPRARWLTNQVLRNFSMKNEVTSVLMKGGEWQQPLLHHFPALRNIRIRGDFGLELLPWYFPTDQITTLDLSRSMIWNLAPVAAFPNLVKLSLPNNVAVKNTHVLESLQALKTLVMGAEGEESLVDDLSFLEKLPNLTEIKVIGIRATLVPNPFYSRYIPTQASLAPLAYLTKLEKLDISRSVITDFRFLQASATSLKSLIARQASFIGSRTGTSETRAFVSSLVNLQELDLETSTMLDDVGLEPLATLVNLKSLKLGEKEFDDMSSLAALTELRTLKIRGKPYADWRPIANLTKLETLNQKSSGVSSDLSIASILAKLPNLRELSSPVALSPDSPLEQLRSLTLTSKLMPMSRDNAIPLDKISPNIKVLCLSGCFDLTRLGLSNMKQLEEFEYGGNGGARNGGGVVLPTVSWIDYAPLADLHNLKKLLLSNRCKAKNYRFLESLVNLRELTMHFQTISDISALANMQHLENVILDDSPVEDISPLGFLRELNHLSLEFTKVKDVSCLRGLPRLMNLFLPSSAACGPLLNEYGVSLPNIRKYDHDPHGCDYFRCEPGASYAMYVDSNTGQVTEPPVPPVSAEYFKRVKHYA